MATYFIKSCKHPHAHLLSWGVETKIKRATNLGLDLHP
jgi:hypothetical protein